MYKQCHPLCTHVSIHPSSLPSVSRVRLEDLLLFVCTLLFIYLYIGLIYYLIHLTPIINIDHRYLLLTNRLGYFELIMQVFLRTIDFSVQTAFNVDYMKPLFGILLNCLSHEQRVAPIVAQI